MVDIFKTTTPLRPYQVTGAAWLRETRRAFLQDQPGIGKTLQAIAAADHPALVACPSYLVHQWADVLARERPGDSVAVAQGVRAQREAAIGEHADWTIVNHAMLRDYAAALCPPVRHPYKTFIVDESHWLRGRTALMSKMGAKIAFNTPRVYLLSGTPIMKEADDLWHQLFMLDRKKFSSYWRFVETFMKTRTDQYGVHIIGVKYPALLAEHIAPYVLRRTYAQVGLYLPPLIPQDVPVEWTAGQMNEYKRVKKTYRIKDQTLASAGAVLTTLRRLTVCKQKIDACVGLAFDAQESGVVIYCWYRETADTVAKALGGAPVIDGSMAPAKRALVAKSNRLVVATLASLSEGVDLADKKTVIFFETDYTPGSLEQAIARLQRWTEKENAREPVRAYFLTVRNTVDATILSCVRRRVFDARRILAATLA